MEVIEAKVKKAQLEVDVYNLLKKYEEETGLEVAAVLVQRLSVSEMGEEKKTQLSDLDILVGVDIPPMNEGGMQ